MIGALLSDAEQSYDPAWGSVAVHHEWQHQLLSLCLFIWGPFGLLCHLSSQVYPLLSLGFFLSKSLPSPFQSLFNCYLSSNFPWLHRSWSRIASCAFYVFHVLKRNGLLIGPTWVNPIKLWQTVVIKNSVQTAAFHQDCQEYQEGRDSTNCPNPYCLTSHAYSKYPHRTPVQKLSICFR